eukprot:363200-Chlamydomonas_euryale.AAC.16
MFAVKQVGLSRDEHLRSRVASHIRALESEVEVLRHLRCAGGVTWWWEDGSEETADGCGRRGELSLSTEEEEHGDLEEQRKHFINCVCAERPLWSGGLTGFELGRRAGGAHVQPVHMRSG